MIYEPGILIVGILNPFAFEAVHSCTILDLGDTFVIVRLDEKVETSDAIFLFLLDLCDANSRLPLGGIGNGHEGEEYSEEDEVAHKIGEGN